MPGDDYLKGYLPRYLPTYLSIHAKKSLASISLDSPFNPVLRIQICFNPDLGKNFNPDPGKTAKIIKVVGRYRYLPTNSVVDPK
jgi:hypothetical protein